MNGFDSFQLERAGKTQSSAVYDDAFIDRPRQAWQWMRQTLQTPCHTDWVRREVADSWRRCLEDYGLRFHTLTISAAPEKKNLDLAKPDLHSALEDVFAHIERQSHLPVIEAGLTLCLADAQCRLVAIQGRDLSDCPLGRLLGHPEADWSEPMIGNNGLGSAVVTGKAASFSGEEHYLSLLHPFTTAGFPLYGSNAQLLGVLGLVGDQRIAPGVLKSLACMLGRMVEDVLANADSDRRNSAPAPFPLQILRPAPGFASAIGGPKQLPETSPSATRADNLARRFVERSVRLQERRIPILVVGESGAGKEYLVRKAYEAGPRRDGPFIALNCASIPRDLIESELFGYAGGSFTGARKEGKAGKFMLADKGVLLLDEIGDMGLDLQAVLLRVLENSEFYPIGASEPVKVDVQIFAATNVPIQQAVREGRFRRDLYYRLNGAQFILPPLREREDKGLLIGQLLEKERALSGLQNPVALDKPVLDLFLRHPWPGNVRQLSNVIRTSLHMAENNLITMADLPDDFLGELREAEGLADSAPKAAGICAEPDAGPGLSLAVSLADWELLGIKQALKSCKGNLTQTARTLGITRGTLYKKMHDYGLNPH